MLLQRIVRIILVFLCFSLLMTNALTLPLTIFQSINFRKFNFNHISSHKVENICIRINNLLHSFQSRYHFLNPPWCIQELWHPIIINRLWPTLCWGNEILKSKTWMLSQDDVWRFSLIGYNILNHQFGSWNDKAGAIHYFSYCSIKRPKPTMC